MAYPAVLFITAFLDTELLIVKFQKDEYFFNKTGNWRYCVKNGVLRTKFFLNEPQSVPRTPRNSK